MDDALRAGRGTLRAMQGRCASAINSLPARLFIRELDARGIACESALSAAGLTRDFMHDGRTAITWDQCLRLVDEAFELAASDDIGVLAGARAELSDLDLIGLYLRSTPSVREAFEFHRGNRDVLEPSPITSMYTTADAFVISLLPQDPAPIGAALMECMLASCITLLIAIAGPTTPIEASFRHRRPANDQAHTRIFGLVRFESALDALFLPLDVVHRAMPYRDDTVRAVLAPHLARQIEVAQAARADLPTRVLNGIRQELDEGQTSADSLAKLLRMSPRSLRRELSVHGTSYSDLLAQARRELALQYAIEAPRRSGPDLAQRLGYADAHTFYRAFKRWTGVSLSAYRKQCNRA